MKGIITLCGSTRFMKEFDECNMKLTLADYIVLTVGAFMHSDSRLEDILGPHKGQLDKLHKDKISMSQAIIVINKNHYIGESTDSEYHYAYDLGKKIYWYDISMFERIDNSYRLCSGHWSKLL